MIKRTKQQKIDLINEILDNKAFLFNQFNQNNILGKAKIIKIRDTAWTNLCTKRSETVKDIYTFAYMSSGYALLINSISINGIYKDESLHFTLKFVSNYNHVNIGGCSSFELYSDDMLIRICYQPFCNPITPAHLLEDYGSDVLLATNLETQNLDDSFCDVDSVSNSHYDRILHNRALKGSSYIELLTNKTPIELQFLIEIGTINDVLRPIISTEDNEVWAKPKLQGYYEKISYDYFNKNKSKYSDYYPVILYSEIQELNRTLQPITRDIACFGLGSAGTAILDLLVRCNYFKTLTAVDFDFVESKNLRNQWYNRRDIGLTKCSASYGITMQASDSKFTVEEICRRVEDYDFSTVEYKYIISGFDNLEARKYVYDCLMNGKMKSNYLIDCRYLDLSCSIYFIDTKDKAQMDYYIKQLEADMKLITEEQESENTCLKQNFIDIYKYVGAIVMGAVRLIENGSQKPYTHVEAETNVNGLPACMVVRG